MNFFKCYSLKISSIFILGFFSEFFLNESTVYKSIGRIQIRAIKMFCLHPDPNSFNCDPQHC